MNRLSKKGGGYSLVEVMVAMVGLSLVVLLLTSILTTSVKTNSLAQDNDNALAAAKAKLNELVAPGNYITNEREDKYKASNGKEYMRKWYVDVSSGVYPIPVWVKAWFERNGKAGDTVTIYGYIDENQICKGGVAPTMQPLIRNNKNESVPNDVDLSTMGGTGNGCLIEIVRANDDYPLSVSAANAVPLFYALVNPAETVIGSVKLDGADQDKFGVEKNGAVYIHSAANGGVSEIQKNASFKFSAKVVDCSGEKAGPGVNIVVRFTGSDTPPPDDPCGLSGAINSAQSFSGNNDVQRTYNVVHNVSATGGGQLSWDIENNDGLNGAYLGSATAGIVPLVIPSGAQSGTYNITIRAQAACQSASPAPKTQTVQVVVIQSCGISGIISILPGSGVSYDVYNFTFTLVQGTATAVGTLGGFTSTNNDLTWAKTSGAANVSVSATGSITIPTSLSIGTYPFDVEAQACGGSQKSSKTFSIIVTYGGGGATPSTHTVPGTFSAVNWSNQSGGITANNNSNGVFAGDLQANSWLEYSMNVNPAGNYAIILNTSSTGARTITASVNGGTVASMNTTAKSGWFDFQPVWSAGTNPATGISLSSGTSTLKLTVNGAVNISTVEIRAPIKIPSESSPFNAVKYFGKSDGIKKEFHNGTDSAVGYLADGSFLEYWVNVETADYYSVTLKTARADAGAVTITIYSDQTSKGTISAASTGGWSTFASPTTTINLSAGRQTLKLTTNGAVNISDIRITKAATYNVTFDLSGGSGGPSNISGQPSNALEQPSPNPTKAGYNFGGWSLTSGGALITTWPLTLTQTNTTLYAIWVATYNVTFDLSGGSGGPSNISGQTLSQLAQYQTTPNPTKAGYNFGGWSLTSGGTTAITFPHPLTSANTTLYAIWTAVGGSDPCAGVPTFDSKKYSNLLAGEKVTYNNGLWQVKAGQTYWGSGTEPVEGNLWTRLGNCGVSVTYSVTFSCGSGVSDCPSTITQTSSSLAANPTDPSRTGYRFDGWSSQSGGTAAIAFPYALSGTSTTLYAIWTAVASGCESNPRYCGEYKAYSAATSCATGYYNIGDIVKYNGKYYSCKSNALFNVLPTMLGIYWEEITCP